MAVESNVALVERSIDALAEGDLDRLFECFRDDCVFDGSGIGEGVYQGKRSYRGFLEGVLDSVRPHHEVTIGAGGNHVLATGKVIGVGQTSGAATEMEVGYLYRFKEGLIEHQTIYTDVDEARAAFHEAAAHERAKQ